MRALMAFIMVAAPLLGQPSVNQEWVDADLAAARRLPRLLPAGSQTLPSLRAWFDVEPWPDDDLGFGARRFSFARGFGYSSISFEGASFNGRLFRARIAMHGSGVGWPLTKARLSQSPLLCRSGADECSLDWSDPEIEAAHRKSVAGALGPMAAAPIPDALRKHFEYLISPWEQIYVGPGGCGESGTLPEGAVAINALTAAGRADLIVNVLRGYNPGGRVYALAALERLRREGTRLPPGAAELMRTVKASNVPVNRCLGCIVTRGLRPGDALNSLLLDYSYRAPAFSRPAPASRVRRRD